MTRGSKEERQSEILFHLTAFSGVSCHLIFFFLASCPFISHSLPYSFYLTACMCNISTSMCMCQRRMVVSLFANVMRLEWMSRGLFTLDAF